MTKSKVVLPVVVGLAVIAVILVGYLLTKTSFVTNLVNTFTKSEQIVEFHDQYLKTNIKNLNKVLSETNLNNHKVNVVFSSSIEKTVYKHKKNDKVISGFWIEVNQPLIIAIYLDESLSKKDKAYETNNNLIKGLFYLSEYLEAQKTGTIPNYTKARVDAHRFFMDLINNDNLPITPK